MFDLQHHQRFHEQRKQSATCSHSWELASRCPLGDAERDVLQCRQCGSSRMRGSEGNERGDLIRQRESFIAQMPSYPECRFSGRGAVILGGGRYEASAYVAIQMLRSSGWQHPIELWYRSHEETLSARVRNLPGVTIRDCSQIRKDGGWQSKMLAILHSKFEEVLFLDADCYPVRDPNHCFDQCPTGIVVWEDWPGGDKNLKWDAHGLSPDNRPGILGGQYVLRKRDAWRAIGLANWIDRHSAYFYRHQHGDQDSLRAAIHRLNAPHDRVPRYRGMVRDESYVQNGPDDRGPMFVHRHNNKFAPPGAFAKPPGYKLSLPKEAEAWAHFLDWSRRDPQTGEPVGDPPGWMSAAELRLLQHFASRGMDALELGRFCGLSTYYLLRSKCFSVCSVDSLDASFARREIERLDPHLLRKVNLITADFADFKSDRKFELIFIDGNHDRASVERDLRIALRHATNPSGYIAVHDYSGPTVWPEVKPTTDRILGAAGYSLLCQVDTLGVFSRDV